MFNGTSWVPVSTSEYFFNGQWRKFIHWFYDRGINNIGTWATVGVITITNQATFFRINRAYDSTDNPAYSNNIFDFTPYRTIKFRAINRSSAPHAGLFGVGAPNAPFTASTAIGGATEAEYSLDVSAINTSLRFAGTSTGSPNSGADIYQVWGEYK